MRGREGDEKGKAIVHVLYIYALSPDLTCSLM